MCLHIYRGMKILTSVTNPGHIQNLRGFFPLDSAVVSQREKQPATYTHILTSSRRPAYKRNENLNFGQYAKHSHGLFPFDSTVVSQRREILRAIEKQSLTLARRRGLACTQSINGNQYTIKHQRWDRDHAPKTKM